MERNIISLHGREPTRRRKDLSFATFLSLKNELDRCIDFNIIKMDTDNTDRFRELLNKNNITFSEKTIKNIASLLSECFERHEYRLNSKPEANILVNLTIVDSKEGEILAKGIPTLDPEKN